MSYPPSDEEWFRQFAASARWRFAKTYVRSYPHEYTLAEWSSDDDFHRAIGVIESSGVVERFWTADRKYLYVDSHVYWHMGDASSNDEADRPELINRSWIDVSRYRAEARALGYEDDRLDAIVERWHALLRDAKRR
jgi:hypothetical protein